MARPLDGIRVIDLTNMLMAPYTTQILGDQGADVIKVEPPEGDPVRNIGPSRSPGMGPVYLNTNRSKRSVVLDLKTDDGHAAICELIKGADVLVYNRRPQVMERLGLSYDVVQGLNPRLIYAGVYGYGQNGRYAAKPAFDDLIQGISGLPALAQMAGAERPAYAPIALVDRAVGIWAASQINAAIVHQVRTGQGQRLDMPMFEMMTSFVMGEHLYGRTFNPPKAEAGYPRLISNDRRPYQTADGYICALVYTDRHWQAWFEALGTPDVMRTDPRYASMTTRTDNIDAIYAELAEVLLTRSTADWLDLFDAADIPATPMHTPDSLIDDPHLAEVGFFRDIDHPTEGAIKDMAVPATWSETQPAPGSHAPLLGEQSREILRAIGFDDGRIDAMIQSGATSVPPETETDT